MGTETLCVRVGDGFEIRVRGLGFCGLGMGLGTLL